MCEEKYNGVAFDLFREELTLCNKNIAEMYYLQERMMASLNPLGLFRYNHNDPRIHEAYLSTMKVCPKSKQQKQKEASVFTQNLRQNVQKMFAQTWHNIRSK